MSIKRPRPAAEGNRRTPSRRPPSRRRAPPHSSPRSSRSSSGRPTPKQSTHPSFGPPRTSQGRTKGWRKKLPEASETPPDAGGAEAGTRAGPPVRRSGRLAQQPRPRREAAAVRGRKKRPPRPKPPAWRGGSTRREARRARRRERRAGARARAEDQTPASGEPLKPNAAASRKRGPRGPGTPSPRAISPKRAEEGRGSPPG